tara:strand:+ start:896 stop:1228 length:333 start_codon:yes stop_codon:yes gene_type:complete
MPSIDGQYLFIGASPGTTAIGGAELQTPEEAFTSRWDFFVEYYPADAEKYFDSVKPPIEQMGDPYKEWVDVGDILMEVTADPAKFSTGGSKIYYLMSPHNYVFVALVGPV